MTFTEVAFLNQCLERATIYFEWGCGTSTKIAHQLLQENLKLVASIEGDACYFEKIKRECPNACVNYIDIGADASKFSYPTTEDKKINWPTYYNAIKSFPEPDLVLIDGRFRVMCAITTLLTCSKDVLVLMHDYSTRDYYHVIEEFYDIVEKTTSLYLFKPKVNPVVAQSLLPLLKEYALDLR